MDTLIQTLKVAPFVLIAVIGGYCGYFLGLLENVKDADIQWCPVPPESTMVCGYVERDRPNHAGLYLEGTGCASYDSEQRP